MKKQILLGIMLSLFLMLALGVATLLAQGTWSDTFGDDSQIETLADAVQVVDSSGFGTSFTPYSGNPLTTLESSDPWDADGDPLKEIPGAVHPDVLYFPDGMDGYKFWMVFTPGPENGSVPPGGSGTPDYWWERNTLVRSNDGINWEKTPDYTNPLVGPGAPGEWDDGWHADPDLVYALDKGPSGESWFLYYTGCGSGGCHIALAMSHDGKNYTKYGTGPVSPAYRCPAVIYDAAEDLFHMWYNWGAFDIGYATSPDGITWTPYHPTIPGQWGYLVYQGTPGTFDQGGVTHMDVIYHAGQYWMYYLALPTGSYAGLVVGLATSPDGINWTQHPQPVITPGETWDFWGGGTSLVQSLYRPSAAVVDDTMYVWYGGVDGYTAYPANNYDIGLAFSPLTGPDGHVELEQEFNPAEYAARPDTMAWYHMNEGSGPPTYPGEYTPLEPTLAWYHLNEGIGMMAYDSGGALSDDGILEGPPTWTTGLYDDGLSFDGDDRVTVPNSTELNPDDALTIEAWVNPAADRPNNYVAIKMTPGSGDYSYGIKLENSEASYSEVWAFVADSSGALYWAKGAPAVPVGTWTHVAMTYEMDPTNATSLKLYMNGAEVSYRQADVIPAGTLVRSNTGSLNFGVIPVSTPLYYQGVMDEVRIMGRALTPEEIAADGAIPTVNVLDASGNDNHGTPIGGVGWTNAMFSDGLEFDGASGYVDVPHDDSLNTAEQVTIEAWVNPAADRSNNYVAIKMTPGGSDHAYGLKLESQYAGYSEVGAFIQDAAGNLFFAYGGSVPTAEWTHVAMTYEMNPAGNTQIRLYQNGAEVAYRYGAFNAATDTIPAGTLIRGNTGPLNLGRIPVSSPLHFQGVMDELRVLSQALSPSEILADYGGGYMPAGNLTSVLLTPPVGEAGEVWDTFDATDERPPGTGLQYSILDEAGGTLMADVSPGTDISALGATPIRLHAELTTSDPASTPLLHDWSVAWQQEPTAVTLASFRAEAGAASVTLMWETATEIDALGFNLYRAETPGGGQMQLNGTLIPVQMPGSPMGAAYTYLDQTGVLGTTYYYWLEEVDAQGNTTRHGPVSVELPLVRRLLLVRPRPAALPPVFDSR